MVIDVHVHGGFVTENGLTESELTFRQNTMGLYKTDEIAVEAWKNMHTYAGIDRVFLLPLDVTCAAGGCVGTNEETEQLQCLYPDMFFGFASVDPHRKDAPEILERAFADQGLNGLHLHPSLQRFSPGESCMQQLYAICEHYHRPVIFHAGMAMEPGTRLKGMHPLEFEETIASHPKLQICLSQFAWPWVREMCAMMLKYRNLYTDTSMLYFDNPKEFYEQCFCVDIGPHWIDRSLRHQVMFGSSEPRLEQIRMLRAIRQMDLRPSTMDMILGENALVFLNGGE